MGSRSITFTFGGVTLSACSYSITAKDKLTQLALVTGIIKTINIGRQASQIKITGKLPAEESARLFAALEPQVGGKAAALRLDGAQYESVTLDTLTLTPDENEGFAQFTLEFHF